MCEVDVCGGGMKTNGMYDMCCVGYDVPMWARIDWRLCFLCAGDLGV